MLVTGASAGIGQVTADHLAASGWTVIGASRRGTSGASWRGTTIDVDDDESVAAAVTRILQSHGRIDAVVAAAGWGLAGPVETTTLADAKAQMETNFWGVVRTVTAILPVMRAQGGGRIVVLSSLGGLIGIPFQAYYSASKFALEGWAEGLGYEVAEFGIAITLVEPGNFRTDFTDSRRMVSTDGGPYEQASARAIERMANDERNGADPRDVARVISEQLERRRPRRRVSVGKAGERVGLIAKRALPHRWFEALAKDSLGVE